MSGSMGITIVSLFVDFCARCARFRNLFRCHILVCVTYISFECTLQGKLVSDASDAPHAYRTGDGNSQVFVVYDMVLNGGQVAESSGLMNCGEQARLTYFPLWCYLHEGIFTGDEQYV